MEITQKQINKAIEECEWRKDLAGVNVCTGCCLPCGRIIEEGKCKALIELFRKEKKNDYNKV